MLPREGRETLVRVRSRPAIVPHDTRDRVIQLPDSRPGREGGRDIQSMDMYIGERPLIARPF